MRSHLAGGPGWVREGRVHRGKGNQAQGRRKTSTRASPHWEKVISALAEQVPRHFPYLGTISNNVSPLCSSASSASSSGGGKKKKKSDFIPYRDSVLTWLAAGEPGRQLQDGPWWPPSRPRTSTTTRRSPLSGGWRKSDLIGMVDDDDGDGRIALQVRRPGKADRVQGGGERGTPTQSSSESSRRK